MDMKRIVGILLMAALCLSLAACGNENVMEQSPQEIQTEAANTETEETQQQSGSDAPGEDGTEKVEEPEQQSIELSGPWHLDSAKNDLTAFPDRFPGYAEWGASMEIRSDGQMNWHIGADGGSGTYTVDGDLLHTALINDLDQKDMAIDFRILMESENAVLAMDYQDMTIYWVSGSQEDAPAMGTDESPDDVADSGADVVEIVNLRGDEATIYKLADGTYIDRTERRFTYNGTDTWTDEDGAAWSEAAKD